MFLNACNIVSRERNPFGYSTKKSKPPGKVVKGARISYSSYPRCACSRTIIELERMRTIKPEHFLAGSGNAIRIPVVFLLLQNFADELVEEFTWLKELCHMWSIPIKSAGLYFTSTFFFYLLLFLSCGVTSYTTSSSFFSHSPSGARRKREWVAIFFPCKFVLCRTR